MMEMLGTMSTEQMQMNMVQNMKRRIEMAGVKMSPKYGLNPSMTTCFFCGETTGIALMGRINPSKKRGKNAEDLEAPKYVFGGYEPCDKCKALMAQGTALLEVKEEPVSEGQPPIQKGFYPTGRMVVVNPAWAEQALGCKQSKAFIDTKLMDAILEQQKKLEEQGEQK